MAFRNTQPDVDGRPTVFVEQSYENEIAQAFLDADREAEEEVEVIYMIDEVTGEDIELWRQDWIIVPIKPEEVPFFDCPSCQGQGCPICCGTGRLAKNKG